LQSLYESVYAPEELKEDIILTKEEFEELCESILEEAFDAIVLDEIVKKTIKTAASNPGFRSKALDLMKTAASKVFKPKTTAGGLTRASLGIGAGAIEGKTDGKMTRFGLASLNPKNLYGYAKGMFTAVDKNMQGAGQILKDKEKGTYYTTDQARKKDLKNSFEFDNFNLYIVEDAKSLEDLTKELNKQKNNKKDNTNINTNIKDDKPKTDTPKVDTPKTDTPKVDTPKTDTPKVDTPKTDTPKVDTPKTDTPKTDTPKVDSSKVDTSKEIESSEAEFKANEGEKFNKYQKDKIKKERDQKRHDDAKKKDKLLSTHIPIVSKTKLGSTVRPVKPGSSRDKMIAKNELRHGSDHVVGLRNKNADFQRMKKGEISKADFIKAYPKSQTAKEAKMKKLNMSYEPYHIVLGYVLSEGHADTVEEAHYIMTQMDGETIQEIVALDENLAANVARTAGVLTLGGMGLNAIRKMKQNKDKMDKGGKFTPGSTMDNIQKKNKMLNDLNTGNY